MAIEHGQLELIYPVKMVIFHRSVNVYQRVIKDVASFWKKKSLGDSPAPNKSGEDWWQWFESSCDTLTITDFYGLSSVVLLFNYLLYVSRVTLCFKIDTTYCSWAKKGIPFEKNRQHEMAWTKGYSNCLGTWRSTVYCQLVWICNLHNWYVIWNMEYGDYLGIWNMNIQYE